MSELVQSVSGSSMHGFMEALATLYGRPMIDAGLARLPLDERIQVEQAFAQMWVPVEILAHAVDAWAEVSGISDEELTRRGVRLSTRNAVSTLWRMLFRVTTDEALITRTPILYSRIRNVGQMTSHLRAEREARVVLTGWRRGTDRQLLSLAVAIESILECSGRPRVRSTWKRTSDGGVIDLSWGGSASQ